MRASVLVLLALTTLGAGLLPRVHSTWATGGNTITTPDSVGYVGNFSSLVLDGAGNPVVSYNDETNGDLKVLHCGNPNCSANNVIASPDTTGGAFSSIELDAAGNPVVAYRNRYEPPSGFPKVLHCGNSNCTAGNTVAVVDSQYNTQYGSSVSLALDAQGNPIIAYEGDVRLRVLHCGNANCTAGNTLAMPTNDQMYSPGFISLALESAGSPVVSFTYGADILQVLHCGNPSCTSGNTLAAPDPAHGAGQNSLSIDAAGDPVISYEESGALKVLHCGDPNCSSNNVIASPDTAAVDTGPFLKLDALGRPVVAYLDHSGGLFLLKVLHCGNLNCSSGNSIASITPDAGSSYGNSLSLAIDNTGNPIVSYLDGANLDLKVLHCGDPACTGNKPPPPPAVLLVHGWGGSCSGTFSALKPWLEDQLNVSPDRVQCFDPPNDGVDGYKWQKGIIDNASDLAAYVEAFRTQMGLQPNGKIHIVGHSMGGVVARYYIEAAEQENGDAPVSTLTMLGTPNLGAPLARIREVWDKIDLGLGTNQAASDLRPGSKLLNDLNGGFTMPSGTSYKAVAGTYCTMVIHICNLAGRLERPNDCAVSRESVEGPFPTIVTPRVLRHTNLSLYCSAAPGSLTNDPPSPNCASDPNHAFCDVLFAIQAGGSGGQEEATSTAGSSGTTSTPGTGLLGGNVATGFTSNHTVAVDSSAGMAVFSLHWEGAGNEVDLGLKRPGGASVLLTDPDVSYSGPTDVLGEFFSSSLEIANPAAGDWTVEVTGLSTPPSGQTYLVEAAFDSGVNMSAATSSAAVPVGQAIVFTASLDEAGGPILGATVQASVRKPDASTGVVSLVDDGLPPDAQANDGIYTGSFASTSQCGTYVASVQASGTASGGGFSRGADALFDSVVAGSTTGDPCQPDDDGDGCTDQQEVGTSQTLGGRRNPFNPNDYFNPTHDGQNRINDILMVVQQYFDDAYLDPPTNTIPNPAYNPDTDRTPLGPNLWNLGPPDGLQRIPDILAMMAQYYHDCS